MNATANNNQIGVLLLHGLTGTPTEMRPLAKHLTKLGYRVEVPLLAGHGAGHKDLVSNSWENWLESVRGPLASLQESCSQVLIAGLSVGGLLGVLLAAENPNIAGVIILSAPLNIPGKGMPPSRHLLPIVFKFPYLRKKLYWTEKPPYGLRDERLQKNITRVIRAAKRGESVQYGLFRTYVETFYQNRLLELEIRRKAKFAKCPALIVHSLEDSMLHIRNATLIYGLLGSKMKAISYITGCDHVMTVDLRKDEVARKVENFIRGVTQNKPIDLSPMRNELECEVYPRLDSLTQEEWKSLFPNLQMDEMNRFSQNENFKFHSIVVREGSKPILYLPLFEARCGLTTPSGKGVKRIFSMEVRRLPREFSQKVLGIGFLNTECEQIGVAANTNRETLTQAFDHALDVLNALTLELNIDLVGFVNFNKISHQIIPMKKLKRLRHKINLSAGRWILKKRNGVINNLLSILNVT